MREIRAATAAAWRNGWFHTGDGFRRDAEGNFYFVDRLKDAIRRRGENISSFEVESEVLAFPPIREAAAIAVRSEIAEDEVCAVVAIREGETFDPAALIEFLRSRMAHFMVPRYVRVVDALPRTPTVEDREGQAPRRGADDRYLGPGSRGHRHQARENRGQREALRARSARGKSQMFAELSENAKSLARQAAKLHGRARLSQ